MYLFPGSKRLPSPVLSLPSFFRPFFFGLPIVRTFLRGTNPDFCCFFPVCRCIASFLKRSFQGVYHEYLSAYLLTRSYLINYLGRVPLIIGYHYEGCSQCTLMLTAFLATFPAFFPLFPQSPFNFMRTLPESHPSLLPPLTPSLLPTSLP